MSAYIHKTSFLFPLDEKEKYDPTGFRDLVIAGLDKAGHDPEAIFKFLDAFGSKQDYRRYGEALFDILIAGGLLGKHSYTHPLLSNLFYRSFTRKSYIAYHCFLMCISV